MSLTCGSGVGQIVFTISFFYYEPQTVTHQQPAQLSTVKTKSCVSVKQKTSEYRGGTV